MAEIKKRVRVIRVLEYSYPDQETYEADAARWSVPANGTRFGWGTRNGTVIRSATTLVETMPEETPGVEVFDNVD